VSDAAGNAAHGFPLIAEVTSTAQSQDEALSEAF